ncbi:hypothetical protein QNH20_14265 [Neobacillus sp. WH10]|uniref:hypothetical protein n=1 Tax=Neobacillus sp. WH10 TaxID=3047873 RepID=UPI0024C1ACA7|nr:hypothetical protein [Neobacillus sp. WH10]WHY75311.1 hypothetical protein QNH20_14265 [Neobacillus sp. WH10]
MGKKVTFSFRTKYEGLSEKETFTFEKLGLDEEMDEKAVKERIDEVFQSWVWDKLNISYSIVINEDKRT